MTRPLPYEDSFFDAVIATRVIRHAYTKNIRKITKEINSAKNRRLPFSSSPCVQVPRQKGKREDHTFTEVELRTYVALEGEEKDVPHHDSTRQELKQLFSNYTTLRIHRRTEHYRGWCWLAQKQKHSR